MFRYLFACFITLTLLGCAETGSVQESYSSESNQEQQQQSNTDNTMATSDLMQLQKPQAGEQIVVFETNMGTMKARLFPDLVPETYKNFVFHVEEGNYDNTIFHRVIDDFMVQGGDIEGLNGIGGYSYKGPGTTIAEEFNRDLRHHKGALSMARTSMPNSTGSQFFIVENAAGTPFLDDQYSVFGQVFEGLEVIDKIADSETDAMDKPLKEVVLTKVYLEEVK